MTANGKRPPTPTVKDARSLIEFAIELRRKERRDVCPVCRLPDDVRAQIRGASVKKIDRATILAWLKNRGMEVNDLDYQSHKRGQHDQQDAQDLRQAKS